MSSINNSLWIFGCLLLATLQPIDVSAQNASPFDEAHVSPYFNEAQAVSDKEGGKLWGRTLYGPLLFVDQQSRAVIANSQDAQGLLRRSGKVFIGKLTDGIEPSNAPIEWAGTRWTMLIWQWIPEDRLEREKIFAHEMFHRIQPALELNAPDALNLQLDSLEGRVWLQLEWRALAAALGKSGNAQDQAVLDALAFREHRHKMFLGTIETESSLEIAEGIPEYTGLASAALDVPTARRYAIAKLTNPDQAISFVRSFAYTSGPAYGLLLDQRLPGWRKQLTSQSDLSKLLASTTKGSTASAEARASAYGVSDIRVTENERALKSEATKARYRKFLVDGPTLMLPASGKMMFNFNPNTVISLDGTSAVYPTFHVAGAWGALGVTDGALVPKDFSRVTVTAPTNTKGMHLEGHGWTLDLRDGWHIVPSADAKSFTVRNN
jgi:hypothetical protein